MIKYEHKDITTVEVGIIAHGVNCQSAMGSGVAKAIKTRWPRIYEGYMAHPDGKEALGSAHIMMVGEVLWVANCYTQEFYGPGDRKYASVDAIRESLESVFMFAQYMGVPVYLPKIGAGLGGLDWELEVEPIINELHEQYDVHTTVCLWG